MRFRFRRARSEPNSPDPPGFEPWDGIIAAVRPFTMTSNSRIAALCDAIAYVVAAPIPGAIVECGVWRGGSMMAAALTLLELGSTDRDVILFDTFEGMPPPAELDIDWAGNSAEQQLSQQSRDVGDSVWCVASEDDVRDNIASTSYPSARVRLVRGLVENTIPREAPEAIAILRLDTDWYESTAHELTHLLPRLSDGGVLIVDDYGHWQGARRAVDEHLASMHPRILLHRIDYTGRIGVMRR
jgi:O-methyltransferase